MPHYSMWFRLLNLVPERVNAIAAVRHPVVSELDTGYPNLLYSDSWQALGHSRGLFLSVSIRGSQEGCLRGFLNAPILASEVNPQWTQPMGSRRPFIGQTADV